MMPIFSFSFAEILRAAAREPNASVALTDAEMPRKRRRVRKVKFFIILSGNLHDGYPLNSSRSMRAVAMLFGVVFPSRNWYSSRMPERFDVIVIGAGMAGSAAAWQLSKDGRR